MSDARAATDAELMASLRAFVEQHRNGGDEPANVMRVMTLLNRLLDDNAADAARIRELEAERDHWKATFHARYAEDVSFHAAITEAALLAWPHAEDVGSDAPHIIAELVEERDAALRQVPDGWQVVPKEPTEEMLKDGTRKMSYFCDPKGTYPRARTCYRAMLAAAPRP